MEKINLLIVEDDEMISSLMSQYLIDCNFETSIVHTITDALSYVKQNQYSLILLDLNLPDFSGFELLKNIKNNISIPVIVISAYSDTQTKVKAFKYGASDYMTKPIELEELEVRIWALLGRSSEIKIVVDKNIFKIDDNFIYFKEIKLELTAIEFEILSVLIKNKNQIISRENLADALSSISSTRSLDYHIKNIRKKIGDDGSSQKYLKTQYGVGYRLDY